MDDDSEAKGPLGRNVSRRFGATAHSGVDVLAAPDRELGSWRRTMVAALAPLSLMLGFGLALALVVARWWWLDHGLLAGGTWMQRLLVPVHRASRARLFLDAMFGTTITLASLAVGFRLGLGGEAAMRGYDWLVVRLNLGSVRVPWTTQSLEIGSLVVLSLAFLLLLFVWTHLAAFRNPRHDWVRCLPELARGSGAVPTRPLRRVCHRLANATEISILNDSRVFLGRVTGDVQVSRFWQQMLTFLRVPTTPEPTTRYGLQYAYVQRELGVLQAHCGNKLSLLHPDRLSTTFACGPLFGVVVLAMSLVVVPACATILSIR